MPKQLLLWSQSLEQTEPLRRALVDATPCDMRLMHTPPPDDPETADYRCDIAVLDMPVAWLDGAVQALRQHNAACKIMALTSFGDRDAVSRCLMARVDELMEKPVNPRYLAFRLHNLLKVARMEQALARYSVRANQTTRPMMRNSDSTRS